METDFKSFKCALNLEPTFPLDKSRIDERVRELVRQDPALKNLTALSAVSALGAGGFIAMVSQEPVAALVVGVLAFIATQAVGLTRMRAQSEATATRKEAEAIRSLIRESNREQQSKLIQAQDDLFEKEQHGYAAALGKFIILKDRVESNLHKDPVMTESDQKTDNLVDRICALVCEHLYDIAELDRQIPRALTSKDSDIEELISLRSRLLVQVERAWLTMNMCVQARTDLNRAADSRTDIHEDTEAAQMRGMEMALKELEDENLAMQRAISRTRMDLSGFSHKPEDLDDLLAAAREADGMRKAANTGETE